MLKYGLVFIILATSVIATFFAQILPPTIFDLAFIAIMLTSILLFTNIHEATKIIIGSLVLLYAVFGLVSIMVVDATIPSKADIVSMKKLDAPDVNVIILDDIEKSAAIDNLPTLSISINKISIPGILLDGTVTEKQNMKCSLKAVGSVKGMLDIEHDRHLWQHTFWTNTGRISSSTDKIVTNINCGDKHIIMGIPVIYADTLKKALGNTDNGTITSTSSGHVLLEQAKPLAH